MHHLYDPIGEGYLLPEEHDEAPEQKGTDPGKVAGDQGARHLGVRVLAIPFPILGCAVTINDGSRHIVGAIAVVVVVGCGR